MADVPEKTGIASLGKLLVAEKDFISKMESLGHTEDSFRGVLNLSWQGVLRKCYFNGTESSEPVDAIDAAVWQRFSTWAVDGRLDDLENLPTIREDGEPFPGAPREAILFARGHVRETGFRRGQLGALIFYRLAPTLKHWEATKAATPEETLDFLLPVLGDEEAPKPRPLPAFAEFGARLWRRLQSQQDRDIDYWKTVRGFGDLFVRAKGRETLALAANAYQTLIRVQQPNAEDPEAADLIRGAANNLASLLDDLAGKSPSPTVVEVIAAATCLHVLASDAIEERWRNKPSERRMLALDDMGNTPSAFQQVGGDSSQLRHLRQALFSARTGAVRARLREPGKDDAKDVAGAFFNAGVALLRGGFRRQPMAVAARIVLNALGLWWALRLSGGDEARALGPYNGGDCAVNLMGALTDLEASLLDRLHDGSLGSLWAALTARRNLLGSDFQRIAASAKKVELATRAPQPGGTLLDATTGFLAEIGVLLGSSFLPRFSDKEFDEPLDEELRRRAAYLSWRAAMDALRPIAGRKMHTLCLPVWRAMNRVPPRLSDLPDAITADWGAFIGNSNVLVAAGLMEEDEFKNLLGQGEGEVESLGEWMGKNAWELAGALARG